MRCVGATLSGLWLGEPSAWAPAIPRGAPQASESAAPRTDPWRDTEVASLAGTRRWRALEGHGGGAVGGLALRAAVWALSSMLADLRSS